MKTITFFVSILSILFFTGCRDNEIIDSKPGIPIDPVTNLSYVITGSNVTLNWTLPTSYPADIKQPVSVMIKITKDGQAIGTTVVDNNPVTYTYSTYDSSKKYNFTVKVKGNVNTTDLNFSNLRYSLGKSVAF